MILYAVEYKGPLSNNDPSIVTIHTTLKGAEIAKNTYERNYKSSRKEDDNLVEYSIKNIDTDKIGINDCIYEYDD